jgi:hypothetical protein
LNLAGWRKMKTRFIRFGEIEVGGVRYDYDVVIDGGQVRKRQKKPSKPFRDQFGHTPLSAAEDIPWGGRRLIVGTGVRGSLPVTPELYQEAERRGVEIFTVPLNKALELLDAAEDEDAFAVLHVTC